MLCWLYHFSGYAVALGPSVALSFVKIFSSRSSGAPMSSARGTLRHWQALAFAQYTQRQCCSSWRTPFTAQQSSRTQWHLLFLEWAYTTLQKTILNPTMHNGVMPEWQNGSLTSFRSFRQSHEWGFSCAVSNPSGGFYATCRHALR